jgi:hypothetical protein
MPKVVITGKRVRKASKSTKPKAKAKPSILAGIMRPPLTRGPKK